MASLSQKDSSSFEALRSRGIPLGLVGVREKWGKVSSQFGKRDGIEH